MTSSASSSDSGIDAGQTIPACLACELTGRVRIAGDDSSAHVLNLREIRPGDSAVYRYLDFHGENTFTADLRTDGRCRVEVWMDGWYHTSLDARKGAVSMEPVTGIHTVTLKFYGDFTDAVLDEFAFSIE